LKEVIHSIDGPEEVTVILKPLLVYDGSEFKNGKIYLTIRKSNGNGFSKSDYRAIEICYHPDDFGPDGYMLQDIVVRAP
jgi:hypothetical protein